MTYATRDRLEELYGPAVLAQRESMLGAGGVERMLANADALIDGYIGKRYAVPLATVPDLVVTLACALARYAIMGDAATERARLDHEDAMSTLRAIQAYRVDIDAPAAADGNAAPSAPQYVAGVAVFDGGVGF